MFKSFFSFVILFITIQTSIAQEIEYSKKKNKFLVGETPIAQLDSRKDNGWGFTRSFFLQDMQGGNMISFLSKSYKDSLFADFHNWYVVEIPSMNLNFQIPDMAELNNEKYIVKLISENELLGSDGKIKEERCKAFAQKNVFDYAASYERFNDSLKKLIDIPKVIVERKKNRVIFADQFGKIGQGDVVIGHWDIVLVPSNLFGNVPTKYFIIKNINGGIICTVNNKGNITTFEKKRWETMSIPGGSTDLIPRNLEKDEDFVGRIAQYLTGKNLL
jgi:hypothetical protein